MAETSFGYALFDTPLGRCGIAWKAPKDPIQEVQVVAFQLPEATHAATEKRIAAAVAAQRASEPPPPIATIIKKVQRHLGGSCQDFQDIALGLEEMPLFSRQVYLAARRIPPGQTMTYGELAKAIFRPGAARAVGRALGKNPIPLLVPCHRILGSGQKLVGFSAAGGTTTKLRLLEIERANTASVATI